MSKITQVDDLRIGDWIAVVGHRYEDDNDSQTVFSPFSYSAPKRPAEYNGHPTRIVAISLPFIAVSDGYDVDTLDMRVYRVRRLDSLYVKVLMTHKAKQRQQSDRGYLNRSAPGQTRVFDLNDAILPTMAPITGPQFRQCPVCGGPIRELLKEGDRDWKLVCDECGFSGGRPGANVEE